MKNGNPLKNWIWLDKEKYPDSQKTVRTSFEKDKANYLVAEFKKSVKTDKTVKKLKIRICADTFFRLFINGEFVGCGPVAAGGDFEDLGGTLNAYFNTYELECDCSEINFFVQVQLSPVVDTDVSSGFGGLAVDCEMIFGDSTSENIVTDTSWLSRVNTFYTKPYCYDQRIGECEWSDSEPIEYQKNLKKPEIPMLHFEKIYPIGNPAFIVPSGETRELHVEFDKIYSAHLGLAVKTTGCEIDADIIEYKTVHSGNELIALTGDCDYFGIQYHSMGEYTLRVKNTSESETVIKPYALFRCYPGEILGEFECSDESLNKVFDVCAWTLKICRQSMHLDSPKHQEPLACTGDYYIESLMTAFTFGDMRLAVLDIKRTADEIIHHNGKMFHTTYSLIWVQMIKDVYLLTGDKSLIEYCKDALVTLLTRFETYLGDNGLIENPPDYMFVDWVVADGYSMHHPPKALGQTCLNAFYHNALIEAAWLMDIIGCDGLKNKYLAQAGEHKEAFNGILFDSDKGLYFDGLNTPTGSSHWLPENIGGRYYSKHSNILAVLCSLCTGEKAREIMRRVMSESFITDLQPYFMHYLFEALKKTGLYKDYAMPQLRRWSVMTDECSKGLQEGWFKPEESYSFDHSHAWGGTPAYQLPTAVTGFKMLEPGFKKISLSPELFDLEFANVKIPTPLGEIVVKLKKGEEPFISVPDGIELVLES